MVTNEGQPVLPGTPRKNYGVMQLTVIVTRIVAVTSRNLESNPTLTLFDPTPVFYPLPPYLPRKLQPPTNQQRSSQDCSTYYGPRNYWKLLANLKGTLAVTLKGTFEEPLW